MNNVVVISYLSSAGAFLVLGILLASSWRGQRIGAWLIIATGISVLWSAFLAYSAWRTTLPVSWIFFADAIRYGAWFCFLTALFGAWKTAGHLRGLRVSIHFLWLALAIYCLWPLLHFQEVTHTRFFVSIPVVGMLILSLTGVVILEQLYRNVQPQQRWALKFLVIALGVIFAYDIFVYSYAALYGSIDRSAWAARGFINALAVPLLAVAAARNSQWSVPVAVSRRVVFYTSSLVVVAVYVIATAIAGYLVRLYGGDWGRVAEITLACFAILVLLLVAFSGQARSRLRMFVYKNFFNFRHDYRNEWLKLTAAMSVPGADLYLRAIQALAEIMDSPAGVLFIRDANDDFTLVERWNMPVTETLTIPGKLPCCDFMCKRQWIYEVSAAVPLEDPQLALPHELRALPRAWLTVPLILDDKLTGFAVLAQARAPRKFDWEDIDLLRTAGRQVASTLAQSDSAKRLAEARQFEGFNRLTAFMMHDLKNLAAQQALLLKNAERHKHNPKFIDDMLVTIENAVLRTNRILEQLRGDVSPGLRTRLRIETVIEKAIADCVRRLPKPTFKVMSNDLFIKADAEQLATVIGHIIRNAQDAVAEDGRIEIRLRSDGDRATIDVEDNGEGMDEAFIKTHLFEPFFTTKASKGMGIGAYQVREYLQSLGGGVKVSSAPGSGTVFTLILPLDVAQEIETESVSSKVKR